MIDLSALMNTDQIESLLFAAIQASIKAGQQIMEVYSTDFEVEIKEDNSPLTIADKKSNAEIMRGLETFSLPVLSEEGKITSYDERKNWDYFWMVDPLDGTKEFIKRNGEFTVNVALMKGTEPIFGVIYAPVPCDLYFGGKELGSFKVENVKDTLSDLDTYKSSGFDLPKSDERGVYRMIGSRSHMSAETEAYFEEKKKTHSEIEVVSKGSSLKLCMVAEGEADEYPRFAPTMEWDIAAGHGILEGAGMVYHSL